MDLLRDMPTILLEQIQVHPERRIEVRKGDRLLAGLLPLILPFPHH